MRVPALTLRAAPKPSRRRNAKPSTAGRAGEIQFDVCLIGPIFIALNI